MDEAQGVLDTSVPCTKSSTPGAFVVLVADTLFVLPFRPAAGSSRVRQRAKSAALSASATEPKPLNGFYICTSYRARSRQPKDEFVARRARMTMTDFGRFDLAFFRHTERWFTLHRGRTAAQCFTEIEANEVHWPTV